MYNSRTQREKLLPLISQADSPKGRLFLDTMLQSLASAALWSTVSMRALLWDFVCCLSRNKYSGEESNCMKHPTTTWAGQSIQGVGRKKMFFLRHQSPLNPGPGRTVNVVTNILALFCRGIPCQAQGWTHINFLLANKDWPDCKNCELMTLICFPFNSSLDAWFLSLLSASSCLSRSYSRADTAPETHPCAEPTLLRCWSSSGCWHGQNSSLIPPAQVGLGGRTAHQRQTTFSWIHSLNHCISLSWSYS